MKNWLCVSTILILLNGGRAFGQQPAPANPESHKYRTILTVAGCGGGFVLGLVGGLAAFDDATNSDRKVWTTAVLSAVGGAVGGYFLGRSLDKRTKKSNTTRTSVGLNADLAMGQRSPLQANASSGLPARNPTCDRLPAMAQPRLSQTGWTCHSSIMLGGLEPSFKTAR